MPSSLQEFLTQEAERLKQELPVIEAERREGGAAINPLFDPVGAWIDEADHAHVVRVDRRMIRRRDSKLGDYTAPVLYISLGARTVVGNPVALTVVAPKIADAMSGATVVSKGRVDLESPDRTYKL